MRLLDLINIYSLDVTIKDLAKYILSPCLALNHIQSPMMHLDNLVLNSIQQPHGYQFYIAFQRFLHFFRETLPKPPRCVKSSNCYHFNPPTPSVFCGNVSLLAAQRSCRCCIRVKRCPPPLESLDHWATNSSLCSRRAEVFTKPLEIPPGGM